MTSTKAPKRPANPNMKGDITEDIFGKPRRHICTALA